MGHVGKIEKRCREGTGLVYDTCRTRREKVLARFRNCLGAFGIGKMLDTYGKLSGQLAERYMKCIGRVWDMYRKRTGKVKEGYRKGLGSV